MKFRVIYIGMMIIVALVFNIFAQQGDFPILKGPYLGQKPPGMTPEVFAPGIISTEEKYELNSIFSSKGDEFLYEISTTTPEEKKEGMYFYIIMVSKQVNGIWTKPEMAPFSGKYSTMDMCFSPDENRLYFTSDRPLPWDSAAKNHLWYVDRLEEGWSEPEIMGPPIYSPDNTQSQPSIAKDGTIYFRIGDDLFYSKNINGEYSKPINLGNAINSQYPESKPYISPDESFLLFVRYDMPESIDGGRGLYISYRRENGSWTPAKNTNINGSLPKLTPDGKYFFFSRGGDIYWADARIIQEMKPDELKLNPSSNSDGLPHDWPVLQDPYFGQKVPIGKAEVFMDGAISKLNEDEMCAVFSGDGKEFYYNAFNRGNWAIFMTKEVDGQWMRPAPLLFTSDYTDRDFTMSPDGNKIFFGSNRPRNEGEDPAGSLDIFVTERLPADRWSEPKNIGHPINTDRGENYPSCARNGNLYFFSSRENGFGGCDIYVSRWEKGRYATPENLGSAVNSDKHDWDAVIAPDESFIIFSSQDRADSIGKQDLYISYRADDGGWMTAKNMGPAVNSPYDEICPSLSLDGKALFFTSRRRGKADIFWIDAKVIENMRPKDNGYSQDIHRAVSEGDLEKVESLLKEDPLLVNKEDANGRTPIFTAIMRRNSEMVKLLINFGALVRVGDSNLRAPIHFAGFNNDMNMMALLLENGAVIDTRAIGAATPLIHSSLFNSYEMSRFLIEHGADINIQCNSLTTPLYFASLNNNLEYCNYLLDAGADIDTPDFLDRTPLYIAVRDGYKEVVSLLIDRGADFQFKDTYLNRSLLHLASIQGHNKIAEVLIHEGLDVNGKDARGYTPLDYANRYGHDSTAEFLEKNGGKSSLISNLASAENIQNQNVQQGDAIVIKLQNGSWGIRTRKHFLIFGYSEIGNPPPDPSILNGYITGDEMTDAPWVYFDLGSHPPKAVFSLQGGTPIYSMQDRVKHLSFVLNETFDRYYAGLNLSHSYFPKPQKPLEIGDLKVTVVPSYRNKKGYFIECDSLILFWLSGLSDDYITSKKDAKAIEFVKENFPDIDLLFLGTPDGIGPEKGNGIREAYLESLRLDPKAVFFMGKEPLEKRILYQIRRRIQDFGNIHCSENPGDTFFYSQSAKNVLEKFPEARIVIPDHGMWGDIRMIQHTIDIAKKSLRQSDFPVLKGPYLGQKPPGMTPEIFAPGIISTKNHNETLFCAYMDGDGLFLFTRSSPGTSGQIYYPIYIMALKDGEWTQPYLATFHNKPCDKNLSIIPDDKTLFFGSRRSLDGKGESSKGFNIWAVKRTVEGFSNPRMFDPPVNSDDYDICPSVSKDGAIYFFSERDGGFGRADIYRSRLVDGKYTGVENIGEPVNTTNSEIDPFIAPDESYLIYCSKTLDGYGGHDLYITFRKKDGSWTKPVNMRLGINSSSYDWIPYVTSDGKYLFFTSDRTGDYDIYWVDAKVIEDLKPKKLK